MLARIPGGIDDDVVLVRTERAERLVSQLAVAQHRAALQFDVAQIVDFVVETHGNCLASCSWTSGVGTLDARRRERRRRGRLRIAQRWAATLCGMPSIGASSAPRGWRVKDSPIPHRPPGSASHLL